MQRKSNLQQSKCTLLDPACRNLIAAKQFTQTSRGDPHRESEDQSQELQHLRQNIVTQYQEQLRTLKVNNYALPLLLKQAQQNNSSILTCSNFLRDAVTDLSLHYLAKAKIMILNCLPISNIEHFRAENLGNADLVEEASLGDVKILKIIAIKDMGTTTSVLPRGIYTMIYVLSFLTSGDGAPEIELSRQLGAWAKILHGMEGFCVKFFAEALWLFPYTLAWNAGT
ncbi:hypothetical protein HID58_022293 [Brassica napus]|uniref:Uncharacterized protein n=1 Tax=Brassica napus TaxID=3708 RepID=A0ABQ8CYU6_BRANA|nr:hypothetical protein HID58_022293 [Brassica napus]